MPVPDAVKPLAIIGLREKILLGMIATVFALLAPTFFVVNYWLSISVDRKIADDFLKARRTFAQLSAMSDSLLVREGRMLIESPLLVAALVSNDAARVGEALAAEVPSGPDLDYYAVAGVGGESMARLGVVSTLADPRTASRLVATALGGGAATGTFVLGDRMFEAAACPVRDSLGVVGALVVGKCVTQDFIDDLAGMTGSDVALRIDDRIALSTLSEPQRARLEAGLRDAAPVGAPIAAPPDAPPAAPAAKKLAEAVTAADAATVATAPSALSGPLPALPVGPLLIAGERHLSCSIPIVGVDGEILGDYILFQSMDRASAFFDDLRRTILAIGAIGGCLGLLFAVVISRGVTGHVRELVRGVREVERGNYDQPIAPRTRDEIGYLAAVFDEMRLALRARLQEARSLTEDLRGKNVALEDTLTKLRRAQEELIRSERAAVTSQLAAQLSHELNNPIYNAQTCLDVLRKRVSSEDQTRTFIDLVYEEVLHMGRLTKQMMGFAKPGSAAMIPTDLNAVLTALLGISTLWLEEKGIRVEKRLAPGLPKALASPDQLRQVFLNLIVNASDAMPAGGLLTIETAAAGGPRGAGGAGGVGSAADGIVVRIRDTGCGIPRENIDRIFDAFFSTKSAVSGVGLGLSISYGIVQRHNGRIEVESEPGKGACFTVTLPAAGVASAGRA